MNGRPLLLLAIGVLAAAATGVATYFAIHDREMKVAARAPDDALAWMRAEFLLTEEQFARVVALHEAYERVCEKHCEAIRSAQAGLIQLEQASPRDPAAVAAAAARLDAVEEACRQATLAHVRAVAALMPEREGQRYLRAVVPRIESFDRPGTAMPVAGSHRP